MNWLLIVLSTLVLLILSEQSAHSSPLTLKDSIEYAIKNSPSLSTSALKKKVAEWETSNKKAAFLPSLDIEGTHGLEKNHQASATDPWVSTYQLKLSENLYDNGESITKFRQAKLSEEIAELQLRRDRDQLTLNVIQQFAAFSKAFRSNAAYQEQREVLDKQFKSLSFQYKQGQRLRKDFLRLKGEMQRAEVEGRRAESTLEKARIGLRKLMGSSDPALEFAPLNAENLTIEVTPSQPISKNTWEYRIAKSTRDLRPLDIDLATRKFWPNIKLTSSAFYGASNYLGNSSSHYGNLENYGANVLLTFSFNVWDWGTLNREIEKAHANTDIADNDLKQVQLDTEAEIRSLLLDINDNQHNLALTIELLKDQQEAFRILERDYHDGQATYVEYVEGLSNLSRAKILYSDARFDLASSTAKKLYYEGKLYESQTK